MGTVAESLETRQFEFGLSALQTIYYSLERQFGHALLRRKPPRGGLLNLGCGPHRFDGWVNADDYGLKRRWREPAFRPDWMLDLTRAWRCPDNHWDGVFTEHVIEHVSYSQAVFGLREAFRTMRPGAWLRVSVPDLAVYVRRYCGTSAPGLYEFPANAVAVSYLTQMHLHKSAWDGDLLCSVLRDIGFMDVSVVEYRQGTDDRLLRDDPDKQFESLYVEARKP